MEEMRQQVMDTLENCRKNNINDWATMKTSIDPLCLPIYIKTQSATNDLPVIMEI